VGCKNCCFGAATGQTDEYPITAVISHTDEIVTHVTIDGELIETTPQHPFYTQERGWVYAGDLQVGVETVGIVRRLQKLLFRD
jgi:intein/homing endonuclease